MHTSIPIMISAEEDVEDEVEDSACKDAHTDAIETTQIKAHENDCDVDHATQSFKDDEMQALIECQGQISQRKIDGLEKDGQYRPTHHRDERKEFLA